MVHPTTAMTKMQSRWQCYSCRCDRTETNSCGRRCFVSAEAAREDFLHTLLPMPQLLPVPTRPQLKQLDEDLLAE